MNGVGDMTDQEINEAVARKLGHDVRFGGIFIEGVPDDFMDESHPIPDYCHSIEAAWEVVEYCRHGLVLYQIDLSWSRTGSTWYCTMGTKNQYNEGVGVGTAPMAVALAFLKLGQDGPRTRQI